MKTIVKSIFRFCVLNVLFILFSISGCSDEPTSPPIKEEEKAKTTATIGVRGGTIGTDEILISIPAGAFNSDNEIKILDETDDGAFGENSVTSSFKISGIPDDYSKQIEVKMKYNGILEGESYIAVGNKSLDSYSNNITLIYVLLTTRDSSGFLISNLSASNSSIAKSNSPSNATYTSLPPIFKGLTKYTYRESEHFYIDYPIVLASDIDHVLNVFEDAKNVINNDLNISFLKKEKKWDLLVANKGYKVNYKYNTSNDQSEYYLNPIFNIGWDAISKIDLPLLTVGQAILKFELFELHRSTSLIDHSLWLDHTVQTWAEELFTDNPNFKSPENFSSNAMAPFNGMHRGGTFPFGNEKEHGYGMSSVIKYLVENENFTPKGIGKMYEKISQKIEPMKALLQTMDELVPNWWPDFFKEYLSGNVYSVPLRYFLDHTTASWNINSIDDTLKVFSASEAQIGLYPDLSAKMFSINLNNSVFEETDNMIFSMDAPSSLDGLALVMFGIKNGEAEYLGTAHAQDFEIVNLKSYWDDSMKQFLAVLVNCLVTSDNYLGETDIDLKITVKKQEKFDYNKCIVHVAFDGDLEHVYKNGLPNDNTKTNGMYSEYATGGLEGNVFKATYDENWKKGIISVTLNDKQDMVTNISWDGNIVFSNATVELGFSAINIPRDTIFNNRFIVNGNNTCNLLSDVYYKYESDLKTTTLTGFSCDNFSIIEIDFYKE